MKKWWQEQSQVCSGAVVGFGTAKYFGESVFFALVFIGFFTAFVGWLANFVAGRRTEEVR